MNKVSLNDAVRGWVESVWGEGSELEWGWIPGSLADNAVWRVKRKDTVSDSPTVIVKYPLTEDRCSDLAWEAEALLSVSGVEGTVQVVAVEEHLGVVIAEEVLGCERPWTIADCDEAIRVLQSLPSYLPSRRTIRQLWKSLSGERKERWRERSVLAFPNDEVSISRIVEAQERFIALLDDDMVPSHADPHPRNWILTENGPVLLDFGSVCEAPAGYDEAVLLVLISLPATDRLACARRWGVKDDMLLMVASIWALSIVRGMHQEDRGSWWQWCNTAWPPLEEMLHLLLQDDVYSQE